MSLVVFSSLSWFASWVLVFLTSEVVFVCLEWFVLLMMRLSVVVWWFVVWAVVDCVVVVARVRGLVWLVVGFVCCSKLCVVVSVGLVVEFVVVVVGVVVVVLVVEVVLVLGLVCAGLVVLGETGLVSKGLVFVEIVLVLVG